MINKNKLSTFKKSNMLENLYREEKFKDACFICLDGNIKAHKAVLYSSNINYFKLLFSCSNTDEIKLNIKTNIFQKVIEYIYTGNIDDNLSTEECIDLYYFVDMIGYDDMLDKLHVLISYRDFKTIDKEVLIFFINFTYNNVGKFGLLLKDFVFIECPFCDIFQIVEKNGAIIYDKHDNCQPIEMYSCEHCINSYCQKHIIEKECENKIVWVEEHSCNYEGTVFPIGKWLCQSHIGRGDFAYCEECTRAGH